MRQAQLIVVLASLLYIGATVHTGSSRRWTMAQFWLWTVIGWPLLIKVVFLPVAGTHMPQLSNTGTLLLMYSPACCIGMGLLSNGLLRRREIYGPAWGLLCIPLLGFAYFTNANGGPTSVLSLVWVAPLLLRLDLDLPMLQAAVRRAVASLMLGIAIAAVVVPDVVLTPCRTDKCGFTSYVYSPDGLGNALGLAVALLIPVSLMAMTRKRLLAAGLGLSAVVAVSGTRSSLPACILGLGFCFVASLHPARPALRSARLIAALGLSASLVPVLLGFTPDAFTGRGALWDSARSLFEKSPLLGQGPSFWVNQAQTSDFFANYSPHNFWWESLVAVGLAGTALLVLSVMLGIRMLPRANRALVYTQIGVILAAGVTEAPVAVHRLGVAPFVHLLVIALLMASGERQKRFGEREARRLMSIKQESQTYGCSAEPRSTDERCLGSGS